ncbi:MAG: hypothetical protein LBD04_05660 [Synergistaceae bacterium]|jgi:hypothetical protein|nr:hypothetical protein [Synergistaceae bacterium]
MRDAQIPNNPQLEGDARMRVFGGRVAKVPKEFTVMAIGPTARINVGTFAGISEKSEFTVKSDDKLTNVRLIARNVEPYFCEATVEGGAARVGDTVVLTKWQPSFSALKVALKADLPSDESLLPQLRGLFVSGDEPPLPAYELVDAQSESDMVLWITRPSEGEMDKTTGLPKSDETREPWVWVMSPDENALYNKQKDLKTPMSEKGLSVLKNNLERLGNLRGLYNIPLPEVGSDGPTIKYKLFAPVADGEWSTLSKDNRLRLTGAKLGTPLDWKLSRVVSADGGDIERQPEERLLSVRVENNTNRPYYIYAVNATPDAKIFPFLPLEEFTTPTLVKPGQSLDFEHHLFFEEEDEYARVFATLDPINIHILTQAAIEKYRGEKKGSLRDNKNSVEDMLREQIYRGSARGSGGFSGVPPTTLTSTGVRFMIKR